MYARYLTRLVLLVGAITAPVLPVPARDFDVPPLTDIVVDGKAEDWGTSGFQVLLQAAPDGRTVLPDDLDAVLRLGWSEDGLLVLIEVKDDVAAEFDRTDRLYRKDSVELFVSDGPGSGNRYQVYLSSGADPVYGVLRTHVNDNRPPAIREAQEAVTVDAAATPVPGGYTMEVLLPWKNLAVEPERGFVAGLQVYLNDADGPEGYPGEWLRFSWHPGAESAGAPEQVHGLRLAEGPAPADAVALRTDIRVERGKFDLTVVAPEERAGETVAVVDHGTVLASEVMRASSGRAGLEFRVNLPSPGASPDGVVLVLDGDSIPIELGDLERKRVLAAAALEIVFDPYCFTGTAFPACDFARPLQAEQLIGPYRIEVTHFDAHYNEVQEAISPGRYGAVIDIIPESGARPLRRMRTLYRQPKAMGTPWWWPEPTFEGGIMLPGALGVDPDVVGAAQDDVLLHVERLWGQAGRSNPMQAVLLAGLSVIQPGEAIDFESDPESRDFIWWAGLKRRLYGLEERFPAGFVCPVAMAGAVAPVLRDGPVAEAGMLPEASERIAAFCREWVEASGEPFTICLARRGIIVHHAAYGERGGSPMTLETDSWLASITKLLGATCLMMLVDQGIVNLDAPIDEYLPVFADVRTEPSITVRDVFRHTSGLPEFWPPVFTDLESVMSELAPLANVRKYWEYSTAANELGGKVIESASGEALLLFYQKHLFGPLGCDTIRARGAGGDAFSTAIDLARVGQMLLNRGAYGNMRFFSEATFEKMLPTPLNDLPEEPRPWRREAWGVGVALMGAEYGETGGPYAAFGPQAFGHGAASSTTFVVDPEREIVLVVARNRGGPNFEEYASRLTRTILEQCVEGP